MQTAELQAILQLFNTFTHATLKKSLTALQAVSVKQAQGALHINISMPFAWESGFATLKAQLTPALLHMTNARLHWQLSHDIQACRSPNKKPAIKGIRNILAIHSGKGGVGKSATAVNLALALQQEGARVAILDADIYGPSIPSMLGMATAKPQSPDGVHMAPIFAYGLASNSIGYFAEQNAMIWRGPMASKALLQLLQETLWPETDYLLIDMPPGTGDLQITLAQNIPVTGAVIVTTPQEIALKDAEKGILMFQKVQVPILGIVENMSEYHCRHCGQAEHIFGSNGTIKLAEQYHYPLLAKIPLHISLREDLDLGCPTLIREPNGILSAYYRTLAAQVAADIYWANPHKVSTIPCQIVE